MTNYPPCQLELATWIRDSFETVMGMGDGVSVDCYRHELTKIDRAIGLLDHDRMWTLTRGLKLHRDHMKRLLLASQDEHLFDYVRDDLPRLRNHYSTIVERMESWTNKDELPPWMVKE